jgi:hypothetical protein
VVVVEQVEPLAQRVELVVLAGLELLADERHGCIPDLHHAPDALGPHAGERRGLDDTLGHDVEPAVPQEVGAFLGVERGS